MYHEPCYSLCETMVSLSSMSISLNNSRHFRVKTRKYTFMFPENRSVGTSLTTTVPMPRKRKTTCTLEMHFAACHRERTEDVFSLRWRHNDHAGVSNHQPHGCLLNRLFRRKSKKTSKLRVTGLCAGNSPGTGEFPAQMASYAENVSIWWRYHVVIPPECIGNFHRRIHDMMTSWHGNTFHITGHFWPESINGLRISLTRCK